MVKNFIVLLLSLSFSLHGFTQKDCSHDNTGLIPLPDLGTDYYRGEMGGLYPEGSNERPAAYHELAMGHVAQIEPLNADGVFDEEGKIVMMSIGASNPGAEFNKFIAYTPYVVGLNSKLQMVNGCDGAVGIEEMKTVSDDYWNYINNLMTTNDVVRDQVQIIWIEQDNMHNGDTSFPAAPLALVNDYKQLLATVHELFPNVKICYISARAYAGYVDTDGLLLDYAGLIFPRDYYNGFAIKWLIENIINGEAGYETEGPSADIPIVSWASYHWSDGSNPNGAGLFLDCAEDVGPDGLHLTTYGEAKMALQLLNFFTTDETAATWFFAHDYSDVNDITTPGSINIYPNPVGSGQLQFSTDAFDNNEELLITIYSADGREQFSNTAYATGQFTMDTGDLLNGIYFLTISTGEKTITEKFILQK